MDAVRDFVLNGALFDNWYEKKLNNDASHVENKLVCCL